MDYYPSDFKFLDTPYQNIYVSDRDLEKYNKTSNKIVLQWNQFIFYYNKLKRET